VADKGDAATPIRRKRNRRPGFERDMMLQVGYSPCSVNEFTRGGGRFAGQNSSHTDGRFVSADSIIFPAGYPAVRGAAIQPRFMSVCHTVREPRAAGRNSGGVGLNGHRTT